MGTGPRTAGRPSGQLISSRPTNAPHSSARMKPGRSTGRMPENVLVKERAITTAGLANQKRFSDLQKKSLLFTANHRLNPPILSRQRGARERHERGGRLRWALASVAAREGVADVRRELAPAKPCGPDAPRAGVKFPRGLRFPGAMVSKSRSPGRARHKPSNHCAGKAGVFPPNLSARVRIFLLPNAHETAGAARTRSFPAPSI